MPARHRFDGEIVEIVLTGDYSIQDLQACVLEAFEDPEIPRGARLLFDQRASTAVAERSAADIQAMADFLVAHAHHFGRRVATVTGTALAFGLMRMGASQAQDRGVDCLVTRSLAEARAWLRDGGT
jgi:hypothetical protein